MFFEGIQDPGQIFGETLSLMKPVWIILPKHKRDRRDRLIWSKDEQEICTCQLASLSAELYPEFIPYPHGKPIPFWFVGGFINFKDLHFMMERRPLIDCYRTKERAQLELVTNGNCAPRLTKWQFIQLFEREVGSTQVLSWALADLMNHAKGIRNKQLTKIPNVLLDPRKGLVSLTECNGIPYLPFEFQFKGESTTQGYLYWRDVMRVCFTDPENLIASDNLELWNVEL